MRTRTARLACAFAGIVVLTAVAGAHAQGKPSRKSAAAAAKLQLELDTKTILDGVRSNEPPKMIDAMAMAAQRGQAVASVASAIEDVLRRGATTLVMKAAIEALAALGAPSSSAVLRPYVNHRSQDLRRAAVKALAATKGPEAVLALKDALHSPDAAVRGLAASGLGSLGATDAVGDLFLALEHNVSEAVPAIGQLCAPDDCNRFTTRFLGRVGFDVMTSGFDPILFRAQPLPEDAVIEIIGRLRELGTPEAAKYLGEVQSRWPSGGSKKVKEAIDTAVSSLPGVGGAK